MGLGVRRAARTPNDHDVDAIAMIDICYNSKLINDARWIGLMAEWFRYFAGAADGRRLVPNILNRSAVKRQEKSND